MVNFWPNWICLQNMEKTLNKWTLAHSAYYKSWAHERFIRILDISKLI